MALYQGKTVSLNKPMKGDVKKFKVFVKCDGKVKKVNFGDKNMTIKSHIKANKKVIVREAVVLKEQVTDVLLITGHVDNGSVETRNGK